MSPKKKTFIYGLLLILIIVVMLIISLIPKVQLKINGDKTLTLELGEKYIEQGATAYKKINFFKKNLEYKISTNLDTSKIGNYEVIYTLYYKNKEYKDIRYVIIKDNVNPEIKITGKINACKSSNSIEMNATAYDNYDGDISDKINYRIEEGKIYLSVLDSSNNKTQIIEDLNYVDNENPKISLKGSQTLNLYVGEEYEEYGATAYDSCDGNITNDIKISGVVDTSKVGVYYKTYTVSDSYGNKISLKRTINVIDKKQVEKGTVYLTFDDGPGPYTEELLEILSQNNIKATFFVTNQFSKYQYIIKKEFEQGHVVGIHTYSHKWNIYNSVETYLEDFYKIENIVYEQTGIHPKLFRFPGGSSNTVSKNYSKGIMTKLTTLMTEKGYIYFDWSFDSGDTVKNHNSTQDIIKTVKSYLNKSGNYIILMHDIKKNTIEALPEIIKYAKEHNYNFKVLDENAPVVHFNVAN